MNLLDQKLQSLKANGRKAFIPFITAGDPDIECTVKLLEVLTAAGADAIEIGFPYSDPIADGPVIQASYTRALFKKLQVDDIFKAVGSRGNREVPLLAMVSYALVHRKGVARFITNAKEAGFAGLIVPDLPVEESGEIGQHCNRLDLKLVQLITPTTPPDRARRIAKECGGFVYVVSVTGITGERKEIAPELGSLLQMIKDVTSLPVCVGFGISNADQVRVLKYLCDGVIVGSAIVRHLEKVGVKPFAAVAEDISALVQSLVAALNSH